jgi:hypothetical protein
MARKTPSPIAAGAPLALTTCLGALIGSILQEPSLGVVIGVGVGVAIAVGLWLVDRRRVGE